ncbi:LacI family DNA-binding transcriptional regulator [Rathayibacter sp. CAU 1779]
MIVGKEAHTAVSRRPTQADIARAVGVSQATVSLVLQGAPVGSRVLPETRQRVLEVAEELGYVPNVAARSLVGGRNYLLGFHTFEQVFPSDQRDFYFPFLLGVERAATARGYDLLLFSSLPESGSESTAKTNRIMLSDGCVLLGRHLDRDAVSELVRRDFPVVFIGRREVEGADLPFVSVDYAEATTQLVGHLAGLGHTHIGYIGEPGGGEQSDDRLRGWADGLAANGLTIPPCKKHSRPLTVTQLRTWLDDGITAVLVEPGEDDSNVKTLEDLADELGISIPGDLSVAVVGDPDFTLSRRNDWTRFRMNRPLMAERAVELLVDILDGQETDRHVLLSADLVVGGTSAAVGVAR